MSLAVIQSSSVPEDNPVRPTPDLEGERLEAGVPAPDDMDQETMAAAEGAVPAPDPVEEPAPAEEPPKTGEPVSVEGAAPAGEMAHPEETAAADEKPAGQGLAGVFGRIPLLGSILRPGTGGQGALRPTVGPGDGWKRMEVRWRAAAGARGYEVRLDGASQISYQTSVTLEDVSPGKHLVEVRALFDGGEGPWEQVPFRMPEPVRSAPADLHEERKGGASRLRWSPPQGDEVDGYLVFQTHADGSEKLLGKTAKPVFALTPAAQEESLRYMVAGYNQSGVGPRAELAAEGGLAAHSAIVQRDVDSPQKVIPAVNEELAKIRWDKASYEISDLVGDQRRVLERGQLPLRPGQYYRKMTYVFRFNSGRRQFTVIVRVR